MAYARLAGIGLLLMGCGGAAAEAPPNDVPAATAESTAPATTVSVAPPAASTSATISSAPTATASAAPTVRADTSKGPKVKSLPSSSIRFEGGDGASKERAIKVLGARGEGDGVAAEYGYVNALYGKGKWRTSKQSLLTFEDKKLDQLDIMNPDGKPETLFFDISDFFGKF